MRKSKNAVAILMASLTAFSLVSCGRQTLLLEESTYFVEYGNVFNEQPTEDCEVAVVDSSGKSIKTSYGSFKPTVGTYTATYTSKESSKSQTIEIECRDTIAPSVQFKPYQADVVIGQTVSVPYYEATDYSEIVSQSVKVLSPTGKVVELDANNSWTMTEGVYTVVVTATDEYGNTVNKEANFVARSTWIDENINENVLYDFDEEEYVNLSYGRSEYESFAPTIVYEGYPMIQNESATNGVLQLNTDYNYGDVYAKFVSYSPIKVKAAQKISFRVAVDRDVEYLKICNGKDDISGRIYNLEPNVWYDLEVDPIDFGWGMELTDFFLFARADEGLTVWVDEITYTERWTDSNLLEGDIADFDEAQYVHNIYQNTYGGLAYATGNSGSKFSIVEYPNDPAYTVLKVETTGTKGGFTYMFDEPIKVEEIKSLTISIDCVYECKNLWLGFMKSDYRSGGATGVQHWYDTTIHTSAPWNGLFDNKGSVDSLVELVVPASALLKEDSYITGIYIGVIDSTRTNNVLYIDYISVQYK